MNRAVPMLKAGSPAAMTTTSFVLRNETVEAAMSLINELDEDLSAQEQQETLCQMIEVGLMHVFHAYPIPWLRRPAQPTHLHRAFGHETEDVAGESVQALVMRLPATLLYVVTNFMQWLPHLTLDAVCDRVLNIVLDKTREDMSHDAADAG